MSRSFSHSHSPDLARQFRFGACAINIDGVIDIECRFKKTCRFLHVVEQTFEMHDFKCYVNIFSEKQKNDIFLI